MPVPRAQHVSPWRLVSYGVGTLLLVSLLTWILAELATPDGVKVVTADNLTDLGRTIGLIAAAAVGVPAAVLAYHRQRALDTASRTAAAQQETAARQHEHKVRADDREHHTGVERNLRERYTTCAEQLSHDSSAIRLAGAYAIASLADDWHAFGNFSERQVCIDLLCSYLCLPYEPSGREQTHTKTIIRYAPSDRVVEEHHEHRTEDSQVRQSILRIIAAHLQPDAEQAGASPTSTSPAPTSKTPSSTAVSFAEECSSFAHGSTANWLLFKKRSSTASGPRLRRHSSTASRPCSTTRSSIASRPRSRRRSSTARRQPRSTGCSSTAGGAGGPRSWRRSSIADKPRLRRLSSAAGGHVRMGAVPRRADLVRQDGVPRQGPVQSCAVP
ncbi:Uncharacterised protein [Rhodococcus coprophilus]|uniref:Uncharacterized protein n=1 Tax=Rhodococcus coprophilus TaxID=38310 RepID=A0A2X4TNV7_9NOCA|nr:Uncharacterised protein [Rhodococcus coprophilus]